MLYTQEDGRNSFTLYGKCLFVSALCLNSLPVAGESPESLDEIIVYGRAQQQIGSATSSSEGIVSGEDIRLPPLLRVGELVEAIPGMIATQHSGTGKANQYFLRGFNLDHGTDFSAHIQGMPINMRTHGHGQGYLDLNFIIPELVESTIYHKGPYHAEVGDFSSAGSVEFKIYDRLPESLTKLTLGEHGFGHALLASNIDLNGGAVIAAIEATTSEGPWERDENLEQYKFYLGYTLPLSQATARFSILGYDGQWDSTDQIPRRAVRSGLINDRGYIDPDTGGDTSRYSLTAELDSENWHLSAYAVAYDLSLYSNFTYYLDNPDDGDQFEQRDERSQWGMSARGAADRQLAGFPMALQWGGDIRYDDIDEVGLYQTIARRKVSTIRNDRVKQFSLGTFGESAISFTPRLRAALGLRGDYFDWDVSAEQKANGGSDSDTLFSPKFSAAYLIAEELEGYANWGKGFHSNDVRGAEISVDPVSGDPLEQVDVLIESTGAELGLRFEHGSEFNAAITGFWLELDSELVYVGDAGSTEPSNSSRRVGVELTSFWQPLDWLNLNASYTYTDAEFRNTDNGEDKIPGAVESTFSFGANAVWENGLTASARVRYLGEAPLVEDDSVRSDDSWLLNAGAAYRTGPLEFRLDIFNLLDTDKDDISYFYASRLPDEPAEGVEDVHFHPLEPRSVRASITRFW